MKPKKLKHSPKQRYKGRNQSIKREINGSNKVNQKYIPLLKSIGMLFDNLLDRDASNSYEIPTSKKYKRNRFKSVPPEKTNRMVCKCADTPDTEETKSEPSEKATIIPDYRDTISIGTEDITAIETATSATNFTSISDVSSLRQHKNLPLLLPGNPVSGWRNDHGVSQRSGTAYNRSTEGDFTRDYGNSEHITGFRENDSNTQYNEELAYSYSRDGAGGDGPDRREHGSGKDYSTTKVPSTNKSIDNKEAENTTENYRFATKFKREDNMETGGNKTKSTKLLPELVRRLRGHIPENKVKHNPESKQSKEAYTESVFYVTDDNASYKRVTNRSRPITQENKKVRSGNETVPLINNSTLNSNTVNTRNLTNKVPVVMIIDGYSVTRNKHGENKLTKKTIHFHP